MKQTTEQIQNLISNEDILTAFEDRVQNNPNQLFNDVPISELSEQASLSLKTIIQAINEGQFDILPFAIRHGIHNTLNHLWQNRGNISTNYYTHLDRLYQLVLTSGLFSHGITPIEITHKLHDLSKLKRRYTDHVNAFKNSKKYLKQIEDLKSDLQKTLEDYKKERSVISELHEEANQLKLTIGNYATESENQLDKINDIRKEIEEGNIKISGVAKNASNYEKKIDLLVEKAESVIEKEQKIKELIEEAETALDLKSAQGISAAFASQYAKIDDKSIYKGWLIGAAAFLFVAIVMTIWIVGGWWIEDADGITSIIGRVVAVGISIAGATFCANQYSRQKNLAADYAYKATLSKSIVAFKNEIDKHNTEDGKEVSAYLTKVLDEIHKDPLRFNIKEKDQNKVSNGQLPFLKELKELFNK